MVVKVHNSNVVYVETWRKHPQPFRPLHLLPTRGQQIDLAAWTLDNYAETDHQSSLKLRKLYLFYYVM